MKFLPLLDLRIEHSYYADEKCLDFLIVPTPSTATVLKNHRCVLKSRPDGITVLITSNAPDEPFIPIPPEITFTFQLQLQNSDFSLFTDLTQFTTQGDFKVIFHPVTALSGNDVFAIVDISNFSQKVSTIPAKCEIRFATKQSTWTYYLITDPGDKSVGFQIVDDDASKLSYSQTDLKNNPDTSDSIAEMLSKQYPDMRLFRFASDKLIPCQQVPRKNLKLKLGESTIFEHLPNPSYRNYSRINGNSNGKLQEQDSLFQIIKYITDPSLKKV